VFEYHDVMHNNPLPDLDIILMRDVLSFFKEEDQQKLAEGFKEKLKSKGIMIVGRNEFLPGADWDFIGKDPVSMFAYNA